MTATERALVRGTASPPRRTVSPGATGVDAALSYSRMLEESADGFVVLVAGQRCEVKRGLVRAHDRAAKRLTVPSWFARKWR